MTDQSGSEDDLVPEADRQDQVTDATGAVGGDRTTALGHGRSSDDEVPEADALEQATTVIEDEDPERW